MQAHFCTANQSKMDVHELKKSLKLVFKPVDHKTYLQEFVFWRYLKRLLNGKFERLVAKVSLREINTATTRNTRDANDFAHSKRLARKKPLLAG